MAVRVYGFVFFLAFLLVFAPVDMSTIGVGTTHCMKLCFCCAIELLKSNNIASIARGITIYPLSARFGEKV